MTIINTPYEINKALTWAEMQANQMQFEQQSKIAITGSRAYPDYRRIDYFLKRVQGVPIIVSDFGGVEGYVREQITARGDILMYYPRDYEHLQHNAETIAIEHVIQQCTWLVVFFDNDEPYCQRYIDTAIAQGKRVYILPSLAMERHNEFELTTYRNGKDKTS